MADLDELGTHTPKAIAKTLTAAEQRKVNARVNRLLREADRAEDALVAELHAEMRLLQLDVRSLVIEQAGSNYAKLLAELDRRIGDRIDDIASKTAAGIARAATGGASLVDAALAAAGARAPTVPTTNKIGAHFAARGRRLVAAVGEMIHAGGSSHLLLLASGRQDAAATLRAVGTELAGTPVFGRPAAHLELIARTESGSAYGAGSHDRLTERKDDAELRKRWIGSHRKTRRSHHAALESRHAPGGEVGPIDVDENYRLGRYSTPYPKGPGLPGVEKVRCGCRSIPVVTAVRATQPAA